MALTTFNAPSANANFFLRVHPFNCRSRSTAAQRSGNTSV